MNYKYKRYIQILIAQIIIYIIMAFSLFFTFLPIIISVFNSFKTDGQILIQVFDPPTKLDFSGFKYGWANLWKNLLVGVYVGIIAGLLNTILGSILAYIFQQKNFYMKELIYKLYIFVLLIPGLIGLPAVYSLVVNTFHLIDSYWAIWLPSIAGGQVGALFLFRTFLGQLPNTVYEAASIDGASDVRIYLSISIPLTFPIFILSFLGVFVGSYNDYFWPSLVIRNQELQPVMATLKRLADRYVNRDIRVPYAMYMICSIPLIITSAISMIFFSNGDFAAGIKL